MKVNIIGDYFGQTGYAIHTKNLALALNKLVPVTVTTNKFQGWVSVCNDEEYKMLGGNPDDCDINIMIGLPPYWSYYASKTKPFIGFLVWEGDKIPSSWIKCLLDKNVKQVWVPSEHTKQAIINTINDYTLDLENDVVYNIIKNKIKIVPHGVNTQLFKPNTEKRQKVFTFIANKGWRGGWLDRGGLAFLFKAFNEEFTKEDKVELLVKINSVYAQINLEEEMNKLKLDKDKAPIKMFTENLPFELLPLIYQMGHVFVSPNMGESFGLPCLEAMACGLPVITTDFGGQTDFVNDTNGWLLKEGTLFEVKHDINYEGVKWNKPSIPELRKLLRRVYEKQNEVDEKSCVALTESAKWTWDNSANIAFTYLQSVN